MASYRSSRGSRAGVAAAVLLGGAAVLAAASSAVLAVVVARKVVTPPKKAVEDLRVLAVDLDAATIALQRTDESEVAGTYSFWFDTDRHAIVGEVIERTDTSVIRRIEKADDPALAAAQRGRLGAWVYRHPNDLHLPYEDVEVQTTLGPAPAWLIPAQESSGRWVIQVHGRGVRREEALRAVPVFRDAGYTSLLISYRNDSDAPNSVDGRYALGAVEWLDVEAAIRFALDRGATSIVLMGWSMGGALVLQTMSRSPLAHTVDGIVLESPVVDWVTTLTYQADLLRLPPYIRDAALALIGTKWSRRLTGLEEPIDFTKLDFVRRASELNTPILLLHSDDDGFVPSTASRALAGARPDIVRYWPWHTARHTRLWNFHSKRWNAEITSWLETLSETEPETQAS
ncbi:S9 family peptidase [Diaminobutyricimonas sp. LJ205]|uniref:alpha/beta hydrolase family protein n=1 Tax=Diaminobutyricimonas sp. LJ205 TaxID=2683590 RepID=UPI0012F4D2BE|nr:alpha/beta fold hydrolase [Diaminobutyricimonas sp. LJ205]